MPLVSNAQDPFGGGGGDKKPAKANPSEDPFADPAKGKAKKSPASDDPFGAPTTADEIEASKPRTIQVTYEAFSMPLKDAAALHRTGLKDAELYEKMIAGVKAKTIRQEKMLIGRTMSGQKSTVEQISEHIYNTEVEPPELPNVVGSGYDVEEVRAIVEKSKTETNRQGAALIFPATPSSPTAFDTRKVGDEMEMEAMLGADRQNLDLRLSVGHTTLIDYLYWGQGLSEAKMPFYALSRVLTGLTVMDGIPAFAGSVSPPAELQPDSGEKITWMAFVTVDVVKH